MSRSASPPGADVAPFVGHRFFTARERALFHGRDEEIEELAGEWSAGKVTILHGAAGVGKSSLVHAGVVPFLGERRGDVLPPGHPGQLGNPEYQLRQPLAAIPRQNPFSFTVLSSWRPGASPHRISELSVGDFLRRRGRSGLMVAVDQAESLFRASPVHEHDRKHFLAELADALREQDGVRLLLCVRDDFLVEAMRFGGRIGDVRAFGLEPLTPSAAVQAVRGPARVANREIDPGIAELLIDEMRRDAKGEASGAVEPVLLQVVCARLFPLSGIQQDQLADDVTAALAAHMAEELAETAIDRNVPGKDVVNRFRRAFLDGFPTPALNGGLLRALEDHHLIRAHRSPDGPSPARLLHPRLIKAIRRLHETARAAATPERILLASRKALHAGELTLARIHAERVVGTVDPKLIAVRAEAETMLGDIAYEERRPETAIGHYREATEFFEILQDSAAVAQSLNAIGRLLLVLAEADPVRAKTLRETAVRELRAAAERVPSDPGPQVGLGQALWQAGDTQTALAVLGGALDLDGDTPEALQIRSEIFADLGSRESAKSALRDLDRVGPHARPSSEAARALALATLSRLDAAKRALDAVLSEVTDNGPVLLRAARVEHLRGDRAAAVRLATRAVQAKDPPLPSHQRDEAQLLRKTP